MYEKIANGATPHKEQYTFVVSAKRDPPLQLPRGRRRAPLQTPDAPNAERRALRNGSAPATQIPARHAVVGLPHARQVPVQLNLVRVDARHNGVRQVLEDGVDVGA